MILNHRGLVDRVIDAWLAFESELTPEQYDQTNELHEAIGDLTIFCAIPDGTIEIVELSDGTIQGQPVPPKASPVSGLRLIGTKLSEY